MIQQVYDWYEVENYLINFYKELDQQFKIIPSFFTTRIISYATFNAQKQVAIQLI